METPDVQLRMFTFGQFTVERRRAGNLWEEVETREWNGCHTAQTLLGYLLCSPQRQATRARLLRDLGPFKGDPDKAISNAASVIRKVGSPALLKTLGGRLNSSYQLAEQGVVWADRDTCLVLLQQAAQPARTMPEKQADLEQASALLQRGPFLEEEEGLWCYGERGKWEKSFYQCRLQLAEMYTRQSQFERAESLYSALLAENMQDETALCRLLALLFQQGLPHLARKRYEEVKAYVRKEELTLSPAVETFWQQLQRQQHNTNFDSLSLQSFINLSHAEYENNKPLFSPSLLFQRDILPLFDLPGFPPNTSQERKIQNEESILLFTSINHLYDETFFSEISQIPLQDSLAKLDTLTSYKGIEQNFLSRRQILIALAALPFTMSAFEKPFSEVATAEVFLQQSTTSLVACNHLIKSKDFWYVKYILARLIPSLIHIIQHMSTHQVLAAHLLTQCYLLLGILESHQLNWAGYASLNKQALHMSLFTPNKSLQVVAQVQLAMAFFQFEQPSQALALYQGIAHLVPESLPLVQSNFYVKQAVAYAQSGQVVEMHHCIEQAHRSFPKEPEKDPSSLFTDFGASSLLSWKATAQMQLTQQQMETPGNVWRTLEEANLLPLQSSSKVLAYIQNLRAEASLELNDLEQFSHFLASGIQEAKRLRSARRFQEAVDCYRLARKRWPDEARIQTLGEYFLEKRPERDNYR